jgi:hypothetical protein
MNQQIQADGGIVYNVKLYIEQLHRYEQRPDPPSRFQLRGSSWLSAGPPEPVGRHNMS